MSRYIETEHFVQGSMGFRSRPWATVLTLEPSKMVVCRGRLKLPYCIGADRGLVPLARGLNGVPGPLDKMSRFCVAARKEQI